MGFFFQNIVTQLTNPSVVQINLCVELINNWQINLCVELVSRVKIHLRKKNMPKNKPYHNCVIADVFFSQPLVCSGVNLRVLRRHWNHKLIVVQNRQYHKLQEIKLESFPFFQGFPVGTNIKIDMSAKIEAC